MRSDGISIQGDEGGHDKFFCVKTAQNSQKEATSEEKAFMKIFRVTPAPHTTFRTTLDVTEGSEGNFSWAHRTTLSEEHTTTVPTKRAQHRKCRKLHGVWATVSYLVPCCRLFLLLLLESLGNFRPFERANK